MVNSLKIRGVLILACLVSVTAGIAQNFSNHNWYFGNSANGIRFSRTDNSASLVTNQFTPFGTGGSAVGTNPANANLLFYTDGSRVFNASHVQMPNGVTLTGNPTSNQSVAICPVPGQASQYYIFTNNSVFTSAGIIRFSIVDMSLFGSEGFPSPPLGNVILASRNTNVGLTTRSEAMITVPHANGTDFWLITHENDTDNYTVTLVGPAGSFTHTTFSNVSNPSLPISAANFSYHEATGKIAVSPQTADRNVVILDFDNATGGLLFDQYVFNSAVTSTINQAIYDTEWSNSGRFLYISRHGQAGIPAEVLQFDTANPSTSLANVLSPSPFAINRSYGLQMAPDSAIYHLYQATAGGPFLAGKLTDTDSIAVSVIHTPLALGAGVNFNGTQFPGFFPRHNLNLMVGFISSGTCEASPISFYPIVTPGADSLVWTFGDGQTSNQWSPIHNYQNDGAFNVTVTAFLNGQTAVGNGTINLDPFDLQLTLVQDTTACRCEFPPPIGSSCPPGPFSVTVRTQGGAGGLTFNWSNGDTGDTLTPDSAGYYYVVVTDGSGCSTYAGVNVREYDAVDQRANIWYFGQNAGIDFNEQPATSISGPINTPEGVSVVCDRNGEVIFSTDGVRVYDRNDLEITMVGGVPIPIPPGIGGEQGSTQAALIIPVPGDETLYYIFTTQEIDQRHFEVRYTLFDLKLNGGDGGIVQYNNLLFTPSTERITGSGNWLIAHEFGNNYFRAYPITPNGIGSPVISSIGSDHGFSPVGEGQGYMKLGPNNILAVAYPSTGSNTIEIFDFVDTTGMVTNYRSVDTQQNSGQVYGIEFAGDKMFATIRGATSSLVEFFFDSLGRPFIIPPSITNHPDELGAIQMGPDGQLYIAVNNKAYLATIQVNPDTTQVSAITPQGFPLSTGQSRLGLPNFIQNMGTGPQVASMSITGFCFGDSTIFTATGTDVIDEFEWSFGDGFGALTQTAAHVYGAALPYTVTLRITNRCGLDTLIIQQITIVDPPANPTFLPLGQQPVLCTGSLTLEAEPAPGSPGYTYLWSTGETSRDIIVSQQMIVGVTITNAQGCTSDGVLTVADNRPQVDLGPDETLCQNAPAGPLDAQNPAAGITYQWFFNEVDNLNTNQFQSVVTTAAGTFEYKVIVTDVTTCFVTDSILFTINASPVFTATPTNTTACGANNGQIALTINSPPSTLFSYLVVGAVSGTTFQGIDQNVGPVLPIFSPLPADTYIVQVEDQVSGCATFTSVGISDNVIAITSAVAQTPTCDPIAINVQTTGILAGSFPGQYTIINSTSGVVVVPLTNFATANFSTLPVAVPGDYTIQVNAQGCVATFNFTVVSDPVTAVSFVPDLCNSQITALPAGAAYTWTTFPAGGISGAGNTQTVTLIPGTWDLEVIVDDGVNCPGTGTIPVTVEPPLVASFTQSDACQDIVTLTASPTGPYTYMWQNVTDGVNILGGSSILIGAAENQDMFSVRVQSTLTGCFASSPPQQVFVAGDLQLTMSTTTPCSGAPFTLTGTSNIVGTTFQWGVDGDDIFGATLPTLSRNVGGLYKLTGSLPGCSRFIEQQVILFPTTPGSLPDRALICPYPENPDPETREILLDAGPNFNSYQWYQGGVVSPNTTRTFLVTEEGLYSVDLVNSYGCASTDQTDVVEECNPRIVAPTAFRPGSTVPANSTFYIFTYFVATEDFELFIYNRWGEMIYQSTGLDGDTNISQRWNGGYNNNASQLLPAGTYSYVVRYKSSYRPQDGIQEKRGGVVLLR